jgi:TolB-like protein/Flp pilus assembly protein TadD
MAAAETRGMGERRLGAIMFTDLVGYSSMTSRDEKRALAVLQKHREILQATFNEHGGHIVKTMGDGFLVEFASAVKAVECALEVQKRMRGFNEGQVRIGIHVGDVIHSDGDILGDAVNVASRLEPLAEPGGICVTRQVVDQIERKVDCKLVKMGTRQLKNISYPVEVYRVESSSGPSPRDEFSLNPRRIAILPLANLSADPNDRYFVDGMTEELISTVSKINELSVISRTSVMRYKDASMPIGDIGRELSVGTVLEGSVRKAGNRVRITTQLIDSQNDKHLWAQSYDRDLTDIFAIQADIAEQVSQALRVKLVSKEKEALEKKDTADAEAYTLYLKGRYFWNERSYEGLKKAIGYFEEAVKLDPNFALAYSGLADCYLILEDRAWISHSQASGIAVGYAKKAVALDHDLAEGHASVGLALQTDWDFEGALRELDRAISLKPSYAPAYHWRWTSLNQLGRHEEAFEYEKRALELDPHSNIINQGIGISLLYQGKVQESISQFEKLIEADPTFASAHLWNAWAHLQLGDLERALVEAKKALEHQRTANDYPRMMLAFVYARAGQKEQARSLLRDIETSNSESYKPPAFPALVRLELGESDEGYRLLEQAFQEHDQMLIYFKEYPWTEKYREDPRWKAIEQKIGPSKH